MALAPGSVYKHYKGQYYRVIQVARLEADPLKEYVLYQALYGAFGFWLRPLDEFLAILPQDQRKDQLHRYEFTGVVLRDVDR